MKKKITLFFVLILTVAVGFAQLPEIPHDITVSVSLVSGKPIIRWKMNAPEKANGYVIKRKIRSFPGVVPNSFLTVGEISNGHLFTFEDTSSTFGEAIPAQQVESYRIVSLKNVGNQMQLSPLSEIASSTLLTAEFDLCQKANRLSWTAFSGENNRRIDVFEIENQSLKFIGTAKFASNNFLAKNASVNIEYTYVCRKIIALDTLFSSQFTFTTFSQDEPKFAEIKSIITEDKTRTITGLVEQKPATVKYVLYGSRTKNSNFIPLAENLENGFDNTDFQVEIENSAQLRYYFIAAVNKCGTAILYSDTVSNPIISGIFLPETNLATLKLNGAKTDANSIIYRSAGDDNFEEAGKFSGFSFQENIEALYKKQFYSGIQATKLCYFAEFYKGGKLFSNTNKICFFPDDIMLIPNAFTPDGNVEEDKIFRPIAGYVAEYTMAIYSRWGDLIYQTNTLEQGWDGTLPNGKKVKQQSFRYIISYRNRANKMIVRKGFVTVL